MLVSALVSGIILAVCVHIALRVAFYPRMKEKWMKLLLTRLKFEEKLSSLIKGEIQGTFNKVKVQIPFAGPFLSSDFAKKIESEVTLGAIPRVKKMIFECFEEKPLIWWVTLGAFLLGFVTEALRYTLLQS